MSSSSIVLHSYNTELYEIFGKLNETMLAIGEPFRARAYKKAQETIMTIGYDITKDNYTKLKGLPGIGDTIMNKIKEYIDTGKLKILEREKDNPVLIFTKIYGVGPKKAQELTGKYKFKTIDDLRESIYGLDTKGQVRKSGEILKNNILNDKQLIGLKYYEDILERIPRTEIDKYNIEFNNIINELCKERENNSVNKGLKCDVEIVGSYRRGASNSGDIDVIISNNRDDVDIFRDFINVCLERNIVIELLSRGKTKSLVIAKLPGLNENGKEYTPRRVDFLFTTKEEYPFSKLYFTGSALFNTIMRKHAVDNGYTMNEHGIYKLVSGVKKDKISNIFKNEEDIFDFLGLKYVEPTERKNGKNIVLKGEESYSKKKYNKTIKKIPKSVKKRSLMNFKIKSSTGIKSNSITSKKSPKKTVKRPIKKGLIKLKKSDILLNPDSDIYEIDDLDKTLLKTKDKEQIRQGMKDIKKGVIKLKKGIKGINQETETDTDTYTEKITQDKVDSVKDDIKTINKTGTDLKLKMDDNLTSNKIIKSLEPKTHTSDKITKTELKKQLKKFSQTGIDFLHKKTQKELSRLLLLSNELYYNDEPILSDSQYDILKEYIEKHYPDEKALLTIGAPIEKNKDKVKLPYFMGSMDKIKPNTGALKSWISKYKGPYVISTKLDGVSGLYMVRNGEKKLYTRGNGVYGQDVSHLIPYLKLPDNLSMNNEHSNINVDTDNFALRGEFIMKKELFKNKYSSKWSNARNLVSGIVNSKIQDVETLDKYSDIDFVCYEVIDPVLSSIQQFELMSNVSMDEKRELILCKYQVITKDMLKKQPLSNEFLSELLVNWRNNYEYDIDGIIISNDGIYPRKDGNPEHSIAFKMVLSDQILEAKVIDVIWTASKDGYLKPRIRIEPVTIGGVIIEYATAFNAAFVKDNKIGIGTIIQLVRSGDVIPHIMDVITPSEEAKMPKVNYKWNETGVDILLVDKSTDPNVLLKTITGFFVKLGVVGLSIGNVKRLIDAGYDSINKIIRMDIDDFLGIDGFKEKMSSKIYNSIHKQIEDADIATIMSATNIFGRGFGEKRIVSILKEYPDILFSQESDLIKTEKISKINGFAIKTASKFVSQLQEFIKFMRDTGLDKIKFNKDNIPNKTNNSSIDTTHELYNKKIVITGFRSKELEDKIRGFGGIISNSVSKSTYILIVKGEGKNVDMENLTSGKGKKAKELGITIMTREAFDEMF